MSQNKTFSVMTNDLDEHINRYRDLEEEIKDLEQKLSHLCTDRENSANQIVKMRDELWESHPEVSPHWGPRTLSAQCDQHCDPQTGRHSHE